MTDTGKVGCGREGVQEMDTLPLSSQPEPGV